MAQNDFKQFAIGPSANLEPLSDFFSDSVLSTGFQAGIAPSAKFNRVWRQSSFITAAIAQWMMQTNNVDVLDNANQADFIDKFKDALATWITQGVLFQSFLSGDIDFYVGGPGASDSNSGLASNKAWATFGKAISILKTYNLNGHTATVHCTGAFSSSIVVGGQFAGAGKVIFLFDSGSSITVSSGACINADTNAYFIIDGPVTLSSTDPSIGDAGDGCAVIATRSSTIELKNGVKFGSCTNRHIVSISGAVISLVNDYFIVGPATQNHLFTGTTGNISFATDGLPMNCTLVGTPSFSFFANAQDLSTMNIPSNRVSFVGAGTGARYAVGNNSIINTSGGGANFFPGSSPGSASGGGIYS